MIRPGGSVALAAESHRTGQSADETGAMHSTWNCSVKPHLICQSSRWPGTAILRPTVGASGCGDEQVRLPRERRGWRLRASRITLRTITSIQNATSTHLPRMSLGCICRSNQLWFEAARLEVRCVYRRPGAVRLIAPCRRSDRNQSRPMIKFRPFPSIAYKGCGSGGSCPPGRLNTRYRVAASPSVPLVRTEGSYSPDR